MKFFRSKIVKCFIIIPTIVFILLNILVPTRVYATKSKEGILWGLGEKSVGFLKTAIGVDTSMSGDHSWGNYLGVLLKELMYLIVGLGDILIALLQVTMLGDYDFWISTMIENTNDNLGSDTQDSGSWLYANSGDVAALESGKASDRGNMLVYATDAGLSGGIFGNWEVPNILYCPENIFSNKIAALDVNFINPHKYNPVTESAIFGIKTSEAEKEATSFASKLSPTISSWYKAFRNLAIVGLLSVLVYMGIRILIGSTASEKAKYKERIQDWLVALCLVFFMHFIMAGIMMFVEKVTELFDSAINSGIIVSVDDGTIFRTNFTGYLRFAAQSASWKECSAFSIMYIMTIGITIRFTWIYLKRFMYLAFFTVISPLVALTYPLDKLADGSAQAFNTWIKEYFINAMLQPIHLVLYCLLVGSAMTLVVQNPIYGIVAMMFISTAEKWVKELFRMNKANLTSNTIGDVAMLGAIASMGKQVVEGTVKLGATVAATVTTGGATAGALGGAAGSEIAKGALGEAGAGAAEAGAAGGTGAAEGIEGAANETSFNTEYFRNRLLGGGDNEDGQPREETDEQRVSRMHMANLDAPSENATENMQNMAQNLEDISGNIKQDGIQNELVDQRQKKELIDSLTKKDQNQELKEGLIKAGTGIVGAIAGTVVGAGVAAARGEDAGKVMIASAGTGGTGLAKAVGSKFESKDKKINKNIETLVKADIKDKEIIQNVSRLAVKNNWTKDRMLNTARIAESLPNLDKNVELQKKLEDKLKKSYSKDEVKEAIQDIIKVQGGGK